MTNLSYVQMNLWKKLPLLENTVSNQAQTKVLSQKAHELAQKEVNWNSHHRNHPLEDSVVTSLQNSTYVYNNNTSTNLRALINATGIINNPSFTTEIVKYFEPMIAQDSKGFNDFISTAVGKSLIYGITFITHANEGFNAGKADSFIAQFHDAVLQSMFSGCNSDIVSRVKAINEKSKLDHQATEKVETEKSSKESELEQLVRSVGGNWSVVGEWFNRASDWFSRDSSNQATYQKIDQLRTAIKQDEYFIQNHESRIEVLQEGINTIIETYLMKTDSTYRTLVTSGKRLATIDTQADEVAQGLETLINAVELAIKYEEQEIAFTEHGTIPADIQAQIEAASASGVDAGLNPKAMILERSSKQIDTVVQLLATGQQEQMKFEKTLQISHLFLRELGIGTTQFTNLPSSVDMQVAATVDSQIPVASSSPDVNSKKVVAELEKIKALLQEVKGEVRPVDNALTTNADATQTRATNYLKTKTAAIKAQANR